MEPEKATLVDASGDVEGKLNGKNARIDGKFRGDIVLTGRLHLAEGCKVEAKVKADVVEVAGEFQGEVAARSIVLHEKARVSGSLSAQTLAVREGAQLNGAVNAGKGLAVVEPHPASGVATG